MKLNLIIAAIAVAFASIVAACYPAGEGGICNQAHEDTIFVNGQIMCFDDGDGYPTVYPGIYDDDYPTTGATP